MRTHAPARFKRYTWIIDGGGAGRLMDFARKSNHEELKKLLMDSEQFWAQTDRVRVADVEAVIERSVKETGFPAETTRGYFYYAHPLREKHPQIYLINSKEWFERAIEAQDDVDFDFHDFQILGHVYFELGDFKTALYWYKKFDTAEDQCGDVCA